HCEQKFDSLHIKEIKMSSPRSLIQKTISVKDYDDPFYVVDIENIIEKHDNWLSKMPRVRPYYAVKCNSTTVVLETLAALGLCFDCASKTEIQRVINIGVPATKIIYANPCKSPSFIQYAMNEKVDLMTFDNEEELYKISDVAPTARLVIRIKVDDSHSKYHLGRKFGIDVKKAPYLLELAQHLGLNVVGVSFHVGSGCESCEPYVEAIQDAKHIFEVAKDFGIEMTLLDIGGGFPGTSDYKDTLLFEEIARIVNHTLDMYFPSEMNVDIIAEPGRYYVASAFTLTAMVIAKKKEVLNEQQIMMYYINDGLYGSFSNTTFGEDEVVPIPQIKDRPNRKRQTYHSVIWGPTCDALDCIRTKVMLPELDVGEWMTFEDMGAYTMALCTNFNGFEMPAMKCHISAAAIVRLRGFSSWPRLAKLFNFEEEKDISNGHNSSNELFEDSLLEA
ncbi:ornithine decarboxylase 2-like protein, partial [Dinothrombium tinctorium]